MDNAINTYTNKKQSTNQPVSYKEANKKTKHIKPIIFMDVDDVIIETHQTIIDLLNSRFNLDFTINDVKEWGFDRILERLNGAIKSDINLQDKITEEGYYSPLTIEYILDIFNSKEFWEEVRFKKHAEIMLYNFYDRYDVIFISQGTKTNLSQKYKWLLSHTFYGFEFLGVNYQESKAKIIEKKISNIVMELIERGVKTEVINFLFTVQSFLHENTSS